MKCFLGSNLCCYLEHVFCNAHVVKYYSIRYFYSIEGASFCFFMDGGIIISRDKSLGRGAAVQSYPVGAVRTYGSIFPILAGVLKEIGILDYF